MMTRETYEAVAALLAAARREADADTEHGYGRHVALDSLTYDLADLFHRNNHRFSSHLFFRAAGLRDVRLPLDVEVACNHPASCGRRFGKACTCSAAVPG